jgi:hypothetical protein
MNRPNEANRIFRKQEGNDGKVNVSYNPNMVQEIRSSGITQKKSGEKLHKM